MGDEETNNVNNESDVEDGDGEVEVNIQPVDITAIIASTTNAILQAQAQSRSNHGSRSVNFNDIGSQIPLCGEKDDDDVVLWIKRVDEVRIAFDLTEPVTKLLATNQLRGRIRDWYNYMPDSVSKTWSVLKEDLTKMFATYESHTSLMRKMETRRWRPGETFCQYFYDKNKLFAKLNLSEQDCVEYMIEGIDDYVLKTHAIAARHRTLSTLLEAMKQLSGDRVYRDKRRDHVNQQTTGKRVGTSENRSNVTPNKPTRSYRCYNCNEEGHVITNCTQPKRDRGSCYNCGKPGHISRDCKERPRATGRDETAAGPSRSTASRTAAADSTTSPALQIYAETTVTRAPQPFIYAVPINLELDCTDKTDGNDKINFSISDALVDTGSPISLIKESVLPPGFVKNYCETNEINYVGINKSKLEIIGLLQCNVCIEDFKVSFLFHVVSNNTMSYNCLLGRDLLSNPNLKVTLNGTSIKIEIIQSACETNELMMINCDVNTEKHVLDINPEIDYSKTIELYKIYNDSYICPERKDHPQVDFSMQIQVQPNSKPFAFHPRRLSYAEKERVAETIDDLLQRNIIRESSSPYASPIVLVKKKSGDLRMCIDFRELNKVAVRDRYPMPNIEDQIDKLAGKKYFSKLDLRDAFYHVHLTEDSYKYASFVTPVGQYEFTRAPFGFCNSPAAFCRYIYKVLKKLVDEEKILLFLDDILIATKTVEENIEILKDIFCLMVDNLLYLRIDKCSFLYTKTSYLGYMISEKGIQPSEMNIAAVKEFPTPRNAKELHSFLGLISYFRRFVKDFSIKAKPLYDLIRKNVKFSLNEIHLRAIDELKGLIIKGPILAYYKYGSETELHCDASSHGFGAILFQKQSDDLMHPVCYFSKRTTECESRYHSFELECLAAIYALQRFRVYLHGCAFKIVTDCDSFRLTLAKKDINPRIARWALYLQNYNYTIEHRSNTKMRHVDALSRCQNVLILEANTLEQTLAIKQGDDAKIVQIRNELEKTEHPFYELRSGLVYRKEKQRLLFYVPETMEHTIIRTYHDDMGHMGTEKVFGLILRTYWFPQMTSKIKAYITNCLRCITYSPLTGKREGYLHSIPKGNVPFFTIHVDHFGPIETTRMKNKHILVVVDGFSKFTKLYATRTTNSREAIKHLTSYFIHYSVPKRVVTDRGTAFTSQEFETFMENYGIQHIAIATGMPRANGQAERMNITLKNILSKITEDTEKWDHSLTDVEFCINNTTNRSVNETPSRLLFGIDQKGKVKDYLSELINTEENERDLPGIRKQAQMSQRKAQEENKNYFDKKHKPPHLYKQGDKVMIVNHDVTPGVNKKLIPKFKGPYKVAEILEHDRYVLEDLDNFQVTNRPFRGVFHPSMMKPYSQ